MKPHDEFVLALGDCAESIAGGFVAGRLKTRPGTHPLRVVQVRDVADVLAPVYALDVVTVPNPDVVARQRLRSGDVVVTTRGTEVRSAVVPDSHAGALAGPNTAVVRLKPGLAPALVAAWLRHPRTQRALLAERTGAATSGFNVSQLARLPIAVPTHGNQEQLSELTRLAEAHYAAAVTAAAERRAMALDLVADALSPDTGGERHA